MPNLWCFIRRNSQLILGICIMVAIVVAADAVFIRARIRTRAAHHAHRPSRGRGPEGWRNVNRIGEITGSDEAGEIETIDENPFASIMDRRRRR